MGKTLVKGYIRIIKNTDPLVTRRSIVLVDGASNTIIEFEPGKEVVVQIETSESSG